MDPIKFTPLASSSAGNAYKLVGGGSTRPLLIDCGISFKDIQAGLEYKTSDLAAVLISHAHGDHIKAAIDILRLGVKGYASFETWETLDQKRPGALTGLPYVAVKPGEEWGCSGGWRVKCFEAVHDMPGTLGFVIGAPSGERCLYLTDSAYSLYKFPGITHWFVECNFSQELLNQNVRSGHLDQARFNRTTKTHMSLERLLKTFEANDMSTCKEIHLLHLSNANSDEVEFKIAVQRATGKPVYVAAERAEAMF